MNPKEIKRILFQTVNYEHEGNEETKELKITG